MITNKLQRLQGLQISVCNPGWKNLVTNKAEGLQIFNICNQGLQSGKPVFELKCALKFLDLSSNQSEQPLLVYKETF